MKCPKLVFTLFLLFISIAVFESSVSSAAQRKATSCHSENLLTEPSSKKRVEDHTTAKGILEHGEHWVDLILSQAGASNFDYYNLFRLLALEIVEQINTGVVPRVNEKIDGSPSIVVGFDNQDRPFVAYKKEISKVKAKQTIITSSEDAEASNLSPGLKQLLSQVITLIGPKLKKLPKLYRNYLFQGDLLFSPDSDRIFKSKQGIVISANQVAYKLKPENRFFDEIQNAKLGVVFHTIGQRVLADNGQISVLPIDKDQQIADFVAKINGGKIFAIHPWKENIPLSRNDSRFKNEIEPKIDSLLNEINNNLKDLPDDFRSPWLKQHEYRFRIFFNHFLSPPHTGGIYFQASVGEEIDPDEILTQYDHWVSSRTLPREVFNKKKQTSTLKEGLESKAYHAEYLNFLEKHRQKLKNVILAYYYAIRIQYLLWPYIDQMFLSKLGGTESEGIILKNNGAIVKLVNRLGFTMKNRNFNLWRRNQVIRPSDDGSSQSEKAVLEIKSAKEPFDRWRPNALFLVMKLQPVHAGHIELIRKAIEQSGGNEVIVIASAKSPNLNSSSIDELGTAKTKKDIYSRNYTYVFDQEIRKKMLEEGLKAQGLDNKVKIYFLDTADFWNQYVFNAKANHLDGKIKFVISSKEMTIKEDAIALDSEDEPATNRTSSLTGRYTHQFQENSAVLEPLIIELQSDGISATQVRSAIRDCISGTSLQKQKAKQFLHKALGYIPSKRLREQMIQELIDQWHTMDTAVFEVL